MRLASSGVDNGRFTGDRESGQRKLQTVLKANLANFFLQSSWLESGQYRNSVRMHSKKHYNGGLSILDVDHVPTGCSSWPAFWLCGLDWPIGGEVHIFCQSQGRAHREAGQIDIMESIHLGTRNQMTLHTDYGKMENVTVATDS